ncbi:alpha-galactosidase [Candidatus Symbiothrix dinenymphae]|nr:alpha-galactosidase [Candidatus Symbiothrix dinenymphae]
MNIKVFKLICGMQLLLATTAWSQEQTAVLDNGLIRREIDFSENHIFGKSYSMGQTQFIANKSPEFALSVNDVPYSGNSEWKNIQRRDTAESNGGKGLILSLERDKSFTVELLYMVYPNLPVVHKALRVKNIGRSDLKVEAVDVENLYLSWGATNAWIMHQYARQKWLGPYIGNCNDPLIIVHDTWWDRGIAIGNEAFGVTKRTSVYVDGRSVSAGLTHPEEEFGFRKWLRPGDQWLSPWVFTALYNNTPDPSVVLSTVVSDFVRKHVGMRIEQLPQKPMFVYNTWVPFYQNINETLVKEVAKAASECGVEEFIIDDGWQIGTGSSDRVRTEESVDEQEAWLADWKVNTEKFPNGLRPVFDYIKSLGMKPGLWLSIAIADPTNRTYFKEHPEWFVVGKDGQLGNLHTEHGQNKTACMGTEWYDYIKKVALHLAKEHGLSYLKLDLAIVASAYVFDRDRSGCYADNHPWHRDREESYEVIYRRCMQLFDDLHREVPELFIDCTFETAGKLQLMDYGIAKHAEGNWLSNVEQTNQTGPLRVRNLAWGRTPALPATSLVIGNMRMDSKNHELAFKSLTGTLPIMLGDPRKLSAAEKKTYKLWAEWTKKLEARHGYMSFRQDLPGFGEPQEGCWDGFSRLNTETGSGGLVGVFRQGAVEESRLVVIPWLNPDKTYVVKQGYAGKIIATLSGKDLAEKG